MSAASPTTAVRKAQARSRVTNGKDLLPGIDGRSAVARWTSSRPSPPMPAVRDSSRKRGGSWSAASALAVLAESIEARLAMGETVELAEHCTISSTLARLATRLGINRHAKVVIPLRDYLESKAGAPVAGLAP
jgi:hypothetical protein